MLQLYRGHRLSHGIRTLGESVALLSSQLDLDDLLQTTAAELARHAEEETGHSVLALEPRGARKDAF